MIPFAVMSTEKLGLPDINISNEEEKVVTFPLGGGAGSNLGNGMAVKTAVLNLWAFKKELRAAHIFRFKKETVDWHLFEPSNDPLNQYELNGQMMFSIRAIQQTDFQSEMIIEPSEKKFINKRGKLHRALASIQPEDQVYIVLVFKDLIIAGGNYFDESTLCKAIVHHKPSIKKNKVYTWLHGDKMQRLLSSANESYPISYSYSEGNESAII